jgi:hypothetical protein
MLFRLEIELRWSADLTQLLIRRLVRPERNVARRHVGDARKKVPQLVVDGALFLLAGLDLALQRADLLHQTPCFGFVLLLLRLADLLRGGVSLRLRLLQILNRFAALFVALQQPGENVARALKTAIVKPFDEGILILANPFDVEQGAT